MGRRLATEAAMATAVALKVAFSTHPVFPLFRISSKSLLKWAIYALFLLNIKSWPLFWHLRFFRPVFKIVIPYYFYRFRMLFVSKARRHEMEEHWIENHPLVGMNPFDYKNVYRTRATIDECDFNIHLSNSSYAKILDASRYECLVTLFPVFFRSGGSMGMGGSHFSFVKEISPLQKFEIRTYIGAWDQKWLYLVSKFVSAPKRDRRLESSKDTNAPFKQSLLTEPDGSIVHAIGVIEICFKANRVTVPPSLVLASNGFSCSPAFVSDESPGSPASEASDSSSLTSSSFRTSSTSPSPNSSSTSLSLDCSTRLLYDADRYSVSSRNTSYSRANPPPHWIHVKHIFSPKHRGSQKKYFEFIRSGWKDVEAPEGEGKWWETALGGDVEAQRVAALNELDKLRQGMQAAKML